MRDEQLRKLKQINDLYEAKGITPEEFVDASYDIYFPNSRRNGILFVAALVAISGGVIALAVLLF